MSDPRPDATALARELAGVRAKLQAEHQAHEQTRRQVGDLRALLARLEWADVPQTGPLRKPVHCPICSAVEPGPHDAGCDLAAVLHPANDETAAP